MKKLIGIIFARGISIVFAGSMLAAAPAAASAASVKVPTENWGLQVRPYVIDFTGDGSGYLGGFDGHPFPKAHPAYGRLRWTEYNANEGRAWGAEWADKCNPDCASGTFFTAGKIYVHVYRPRNGVFTRMTLSGADFGRRSVTIAAHQSYGAWTWF